MLYYDNEVGRSEFISSICMIVSPEVGVSGGVGESMGAADSMPIGWPVALGESGT